MRGHESGESDPLRPADLYLLQYRCNVQIRANVNDHGCGCDWRPDCDHGLYLSESVSESVNETECWCSAWLVNEYSKAHGGIEEPASCCR